MSETKRLPPWLTKPLSNPAETRDVRHAISAFRLNTVCDEARCPNRVDCFTRGTATFMILGDRCTRDCRFCAVSHATPEGADASEAGRVALAVRELGLKYVVVTSVTRDDLKDGGAEQFVQTIDAVRETVPEIGVEVLVPDFLGRDRPVDAVLAAEPEVFGHNIETVRGLYERARPGADYDRSLAVLERASSSGSRSYTKSAMMLGLGETRTEVKETLLDLRRSGVEIVYLGQYLRPSREHLPVERFVTPAEFEDMREFALAAGFSWVASGPFVRSSYHAETAVAELGRHAAGTKDGHA